MPIKLGLNLNPFVNRFAEPGELIDTIAGEIGIGYLQLVHEFINPAWPAPTVRRLTGEMAEACARRGVKITSLMTGPYGRLNHFGHPDADVREYYLKWFEGLVDIAAEIGCPAVGTQYAILTYRDYDDPARREAILSVALDCWRRLADHAAERGLEFLFWEPMSVGRELGHTIAATRGTAGSPGSRRPRRAAEGDDRHRSWRCLFGRSRRHRPLRLGERLRRALADHPHQAKLGQQGRPLALHRGAQSQRPHHPGKADRDGSSRAAAATTNCAWSSPSASASPRTGTSSG